MIQAVFDANTILSGMARFRRGTSPPAVILRAWTMGDFDLLLSGFVLDEIVRNLAKPYFIEHVGPDVRRDMLDAFANQAYIVEITHEVSGVASHPEDDHVLSVVASASADYLETSRCNVLWHFTAPRSSVHECSRRSSVHERITLLP